MYLKLLVLTSALFLAACQGNTEGTDINLDVKNDAQDADSGGEEGFQKIQVLIILKLLTPVAKILLTILLMTC